MTTPSLDTFISERLADDALVRDPRVFACTPEGDLRIALRTRWEASHDPHLRGEAQSVDAGERARNQALFVRRHLPAAFANVGSGMFEPARLRCRGTHVEVPEFVRVSGPLHIIVPREHGPFEVLRLDRDRCVFRADRMVAWDEHLYAELGTMPAALPGGTSVKASEDPALGRDWIRVSGAGEIALRAPGGVRAHRLREPDVVWIDAARLLGWVGDLGAVYLPSADAAPQPRLECRGTGTLLLCGEER